MAPVTVLIVGTARMPHEILAVNRRVVHVGNVNETAIDDCHSDARSIQALGPCNRRIDGFSVIVEDGRRRPDGGAEKLAFGRDVDHVGIGC